MALRGLQCLLGFCHFEGEGLEVSFRGVNLAVHHLDALDGLACVANVLCCGGERSRFSGEPFENPHALHRQSNCFFALAPLPRQLQQVLLDAVGVLDDLQESLLFVSYISQSISRVLEHASFGGLLRALRDYFC